MKEVRKLLFIASIILFVSSYKICDFFYYNDDIKDLKLWWDLKSNLYSTIILLVFYASSIGRKGVLRFILNIGVGFAFSNVIDKVFFNVLEFNQNDIVMIILTVCFSVLSYLKDRNNWRK